MKKVVVHGVHRSGTSFCASMLEKAGLWFSDDEFKMPAQADNPKGFWERTDVTSLNDEMLASIGLTWFSFQDKLSDSQQRELKKKYGSAIEEVCARLDVNNSWFLKDPRLSLTWPIWQSYLAPTDHIVVHRHPYAVAQSLNARNGISINQGLIFWYQQMRCIASGLKNEKNIHYLNFSTTDSLQGWHSVFSKIFDDETSLLNLDEKAITEQFDATLVHHTSNESNGIQYKLQELVENARQLCEAGKLSDLLLLPEIESSSVELLDLGDTTAKYLNLQSRLTELEMELSSSRNAEKRAQKVYDDVTNELSSCQGVNSKLQSSYEKVENKLYNLRDANSHLQKTCDNFEASNMRLKESYDDIEAKLTGLQKESVKVKGELKSIQEELSDSKNENTRLQSLYDEISNKLQQSNEKIESLNERLIQIAVIVKRQLTSKRAILPSVLTKLKLIKPINLHEALNIAVFNQPSSDLAVLKKLDSSRYLLLKTLFKNPKMLIDKFSISRLLMGIKLLIGSKDSNPNIRQALEGYTQVSHENSEQLDLYTPENVTNNERIEFKQFSNPTVSIVIPVYNEYETTLSCLQSIKSNTDSNEIEYQIIIADDASTDQTCAISEYVSGIQVIRNKENLGFLKNCNNALNQTNSDYILLLNNDTNVQQGWLSELLEHLQSDNSIGVVGPKFVYPDGRLQEAGGIIFGDGSGWNYGRFDSPDLPQYNFYREVDYISGACLLFSNKLWKTVGGFDTQFTPAYYEDTDFCFQVRDLGYKVKYVPTSVVVHFEGVSHGSDEGSGIKKYQVRNKEIFLKKWQNALSQNHYVDSNFVFKARNHGNAKKTLLFIDHYVPFYDKDAGSKVAQRYIELMLEEGVQVIFIGDNFFPHQPYTAELQKMGVEVLHGEYFKNNWFDWLTENQQHIDTVYFNRPHITQVYIDKVCSLEKPPFLVYHGADLHYLRVQRENELGINNSDITAEQWKAIELDIMRKCDLSLWLSDLEVELVRKEDADINVSLMPMYWFGENALEQKLNAVDKNNIIFVGSFGHPPNVDGLEWFLKEVFPALVEGLPDVKLTIIGSNCPEKIHKLESANINVLGYVDEQKLEESYKDAKVSIVPLRYGAGVKGKVIESMKFGVPVVTTSIGAEGLPGNADSYLSITDSAEGFIEQLISLLTDDQTWKGKALNTQQVLTESFSRQTAVDVINSMFRKNN